MEKFSVMYSIYALEKKKPSETRNIISNGSVNFFFTENLYSINTKIRYQGITCKI